jgi:hypothetical protein
MAARRAVITTNIEQNPECVIHGESGLLYAAEDEAALSAALLLLHEPASEKPSGQPRAKG